ncbi:MAG: helix-turn-helix domain-containing protein [Pseudomonadota bacterium]|nr:helix-turn-helix domain-containing protein [Pseudomonadota bacterium]
MSELFIMKRGDGPHPIDVQVGEFLKVMRLLKGWTQEKLAGKLGVSFQQLQKYERGLNRISASRLYQLSVILDVPIEKFFGNSGASPKGTLLTPQEAVYINMLRNVPEKLREKLISIIKVFADPHYENIL